MCNDYPVLYGTPYRDLNNHSMIEVWCPTCRDMHHHGWPADAKPGHREHRAPHCLSRPRGLGQPFESPNLDGYYIMDAQDAPQVPMDAPPPVVEGRLFKQCGELRVMVTGCPFCGGSHVHGWNRPQTVSQRTSHCKLPNRIKGMIHRWGEYEIHLKRSTTDPQPHTEPAPKSLTHSSATISEADF